MLMGNSSIYVYLLMIKDSKKLTDTDKKIVNSISYALNENNLKK